MAIMDASGPVPPSLRDKQVDAIISLLNLNHGRPQPTAGATANHPSDATTAASDPALPTWKILVFDRFAQDMISTLLKVNDLRENGITVHMPLRKERVAITDAPAIYFIEPTAENLQCICQDLAKDLYDLYYINFTRPVSRALLEDLATAAARANKAHQIAQVYDQYLSFICPEPHFFSLNMPNSFQQLHDSAAQDSAIEQLVGQIVDSLYTVLTTMNAMPIIRCPRGGPAELVAQKLDARLRDNVAHPRYSLFAESANRLDGASAGGRPLLVLLDRDFDFVAMLGHAWTYQALVHDVLDMKLNRIQYTTQDQGRTAKKSYDVGTQDFFWAQNAASPFPQVAVEIDEESTRFKKEAEEVTRLGGVSSFDEISQVDMTANTRLLKTAISALPELTARKAVIDMHMNIATAVLEVIKDRQLDVFFQMEEGLHRQTKTAVLEALRDPSKPNPEDKLRLFLMYYLTSTTLTEEDMRQFEEALTAAGCDLAPLRYVQQAKSLTKLTHSVAAGTQGSTAGHGPSDLLGRFSTISSKFTDHLREGGGNLSSIISGVRNLLPSRRDLAITRIIDSLMNATPGMERVGSFASLSPIPGQSGSATPAHGAGGPPSEYLYLDPRQTKRSALTSTGPKGGSGGPKAAFQEAIVFVIGGGNYLEYQNLQQFAQAANPPKTITYGGTEICNPHQFLAQLQALAPPLPQA